MPKSVQTHKIVQESADEYIMIMIQCPDRPPITLDLMNVHGRRFLSYRIDGMGHGGFLVDTKELNPAGNRMPKFCPYCGDSINLVSSSSHSCKNEFDTVVE